jgi:hypothetical protein
MCPENFITQNEASTIPDDCNVANCTAGTYLNAALNTCVDCPKGEYQDEWWMKECKECPQKTTEQTGSDSIDDCLRKNALSYEATLVLSLVFTI